MSAPRISMIVACDRVFGIGKDGDIPWYIPVDIGRFKDLTMGKTVIMGSRTYDSMGRALQGRRNIVLSSKPTRKFDGAEKAESVVHAVSMLTSGEAMVIGGGEIYTQFLPLATAIYMTKVDTYIKADTFFPIMESLEWSLSYDKDVPIGHGTSYNLKFQTWMRTERHG